MGDTICMSCKHPLYHHYRPSGSKTAVCTHTNEWGVICGCTREG